MIVSGAWQSLNSSVVEFMLSEHSCYHDNMKYMVIFMFICHVAPTIMSSMSALSYASYLSCIYVFIMAILTLTLSYLCIINNIMWYIAKILIIVFGCENRECFKLKLITPQSVSWQYVVYCDDQIPLPWTMESHVRNMHSLTSLTSHNSRNYTIKYYLLCVTGSYSTDGTSRILSDCI